MMVGVGMDMLVVFNLFWVIVGVDFMWFMCKKSGVIGMLFLGVFIGLFWFVFIGFVVMISIVIIFGIYDFNNFDLSIIVS